MSEWRSAWLLVAMLTGSFVATARAEEVSLDLRSGYIHSDNINQDQAKVGSSIVEFAARMGATKRTASLDLAIDADLLYRHFSDGQFNSDFLPKVRGAAVWTISENELLFSVQEDLGQIAINSKLSLQPSDRQNLNVLTLGPDYFLAFSDETRLRTSARYSDIRYGESNIDSQRLKGELSLEHSISGTVIGALSVFATRTTFKQGDISSNESQGVTVGISSTGRRTRLDFVIGAQTLHLQGGTYTGFYGRLELERQISLRSRVSVRATRRFGDSSDAFLFGQSLVPTLGEVATVQIHAVPERQSGVGARYDLDGRRIFLSLDVGAFEEQGLSMQAGQDFRSTNYMASIGYHFSPTLSISASEERQKETLSGSAISGTQYEATALDLQWQLQTSVALKIRAERFKRTDSTLDFTENRFSVMAVWSALGAKDLFARKPIRFSPRPKSQLQY